MLSIERRTVWVAILFAEVHIQHLLLQLSQLHLVQLDILIALNNRNTNTNTNTITIVVRLNLFFKFIFSIDFLKLIHHFEIELCLYSLEDIKGYFEALLSVIDPLAVVFANDLFVFLLEQHFVVIIISDNVVQMADRQSQHFPPLRLSVEGFSVSVNEWETYLTQSNAAIAMPILSMFDELFIPGV